MHNMTIVKPFLAKSLATESKEHVEGCDLPGEASTTDGDDDKAGTSKLSRF